ncbi:hypothetical protein EPN28_03155 [Patescibacteria group bacterium]|nr:MAG: hypothetical protein EPN28_03155 [Patescibacteria group bacterium]
MGNFNRGNRFNRGQGRQAMFQAVCSKCGNNCEVPFKPTGDRPVFCSNCFKSQRDAGFDKPRGGFGRKGFGDNAGGNRPQRQSFGGNGPSFQAFGGGNREGGQNQNQFKAQFEALNVKLDKILITLSATAFKVSAPEQSDKKEVKETKKSKNVLTKTKAVLKKAAAKKRE